MKYGKNPFDENYFGSIKSKCKRYKSMEEMQKIYFPTCVLEEKIQPKSKVLDLGCAFGYFLKLCDDYNLDTYGLDVSDYALRKAKKITKAKLYLKDVNDGLPFFSDEFFDLIIMFDIVEHVKNPYSLLNEVHRILKHKGKIMITTPNVNAIAKFLKGKQWVGFTDPSHLYLFTPNSLKFLVEKNRFTVIKLDTIFRPLPKFLQKILNPTGKGGEIFLVGTKN